MVAPVVRNLRSLVIFKLLLFLCFATAELKFNASETEFESAVSNNGLAMVACEFS